jgi:hypothetical protein
VELRAADAAAERRADRDLAVVAAARALPVLAELRPDLVEGLSRDTEELDLRHGHHAREREPERSADDAGLGERRVHDAVGAELLDEPAGRAEHAAQLADVETQHHHARVGLHLLGERAVDGLDDVELWHQSLWPPASSER